MGKRAQGDEDLCTLESRVEYCKRMLVVTFDEHCASSLNTLKRHLHDYMVDNKRRFVTLSVLGSSLTSIVLCTSSKHVKDLRKEDGQE